MQSTLVLTSLRLYEVVVGPLAPADRDAYWQEARPIAAALGIPPGVQPTTIGALERYERGMLDTHVRPDATSIRVARDVLRPLRWIPEPLYWPSDAIAAALVPRTLRAPFGLRYRGRERVFLAVVVAAVRIMRTVLPVLTVVPQARRFEVRRAR